MTMQEERAAEQTAEPVPPPRELRDYEYQALEDRAAELRNRARELNQKAERLQLLEEEQVRHDALRDELAAAGRCAQLINRFPDSTDDGSIYLFAGICVLAPGHDGGCDRGEATLPALGSPSAEEAGREAAAVTERAGQIGKQLSDARELRRTRREAEQEARQAAVGELSDAAVRGFMRRLVAENQNTAGGQERLARLAHDVVATARAQAADRKIRAQLDQLRTNLPEPGAVVTREEWVGGQRLHPCTVISVFPGSGLQSAALHVRAEDGREMYLASKGGEYWYQICSYLKRTGEPCRNNPNRGGYCGTHKNGAA